MTHRNRLVAAAAGLAAVSLAVYLLWPYILAGLAGFVGLRYTAHRAGYRRRRRPRSSWAKNTEALAMLVAAWNTRGLANMVRPANGKPGFTLRRRPLVAKVRRAPDGEVPF